MQELEKHFDDPPLLPSSSELREEVQEVCKQASGMHCSLLLVLYLYTTGSVSGLSHDISASEHSCMGLQQGSNAMTAVTQSAQWVWLAWCSKADRACCSQCWIHTGGMLSSTLQALLH